MNFLYIQPHSQGLLKDGGLSRAIVMIYDDSKLSTHSMYVLLLTRKGKHIQSCRDLHILYNTR